MLDFLGDKISMMSGGRLRAIGTSLFLKNHFGSGYQVNFLVDPNSASTLKKSVSALLPGGEVVNESAGNVTIGLPRNAVGHLADFFRWVDSQEAGEGETVQLKEWSFSNSTLEEVFLRVCSQESGVNELAIDFVALEREREEREKKCNICKERRVQPVTLYTKHGIAVRVPNLMCRQCALGDEEASQSDDEKAANDNAGEDDDVLVSSDDDGEEQLRPASSPAPGEKSGRNSAAHRQKQVDVRVDPMASYENDTFEKGNAMNVPLLSTAGAMNDIQTAVGSKKPTQIRQVRALFYKNFRWLLKGRKALIGKCVVMLVFVILMFLFNGSSRGCHGGPFTFDADESLCTPSEIRDYYIANSGPRDAMTYSDDEYWNVQCDWKDRHFVCDRGYLVPKYGFLYGNSPWKQYYYTDSPVEGDDSLSSFDITGLGVGVMNRSDVAFFNLLDVTGGKSMTLEEQNAEAWKSFIGEGFGKIQCPNNYPSSGVQLNTTNEGLADYLYARFPDAAIEVQRSSIKDARLDYTIRYWRGYGAKGPPRILNYPFSPDPCSSAQMSGDQKYVPNALVGMHNALLKTVLGNDSSIVSDAMEMFSLTWIPAVALGEVIQAATLITAISMMLMPDVASRIVYEREERLLNMMKISGMRTSTYWVANYIYDMLLMVFWSLLFILFGYLLSLDVIKRTNFLVFFAIFVSWSHSLIGIGVLISGVFSRRSVATIVGYVVLLLSVITTQMLTWFLHKEDWPTALLLLPPIGFARAIGLVNMFGSSIDIDPDSQLGDSILLMFVGGSLCFLVGIVLNFLRYESFRHLWSSVCGRSEGQAHSLEPLSAYEGEDVDVHNERKRVHDLYKNHDFDHSGVTDGVLMRNLSKVFESSEGDTKVAVRDLCLGIQYGECFGLLGPNGAGKSTTLSILSGTLDSSTGVALIAGKDVETEKESVYSVLGICPQFDCVWTELTVLEHLFFYARVKGVDPEHEYALVQRLAEMVELDGDSLNKGAGTLSGGQLRRLSIAISLIGNPKVWLLDEPSTGLSPEARRQIWDIVNKQKKYGRCVIITTHSMEEADTLCNRIGIMARGSLRCVGPQQHLKTRFGEGFSLTINLDAPATPSALKRLTKFVHSHLNEEAVLESSWEYVVKYRLPQAERERIFSMFSFMEEKRESLKKHYGIDEYGIGQTSLEEVFVRIVQDAGGIGGDDQGVQDEE